MHFLIVPDSFKNCLKASEVGKHIAEGIREVFPNAQVKVIPVADGGEGTVDSIIQATGGKLLKIKAHDPFMRPIDSFIGIMPDNKTAIIEMAAASGIERITNEERNPLKASSYGTGELILAAIDAGCTNIIIGIGGSATNDMGIGMAMAIGVEFLDAQNQPIQPCSGKIDQIVKIDISKTDKRIFKTNIKIACDVKNTLCGDQGATAVFGPQKGATPEMILFLDKAIYKLAQLVETQFKITLLELKGGGAAGGLGAGLVAFTRAEISEGFPLISKLINLENEISQADIVITAEGAIDYQTLYGKTPAGVAKIAKKFNCPVFVFAGSASEDSSNFNEENITTIIPITRRPVELHQAINFAPIWLKQAAKELCHTLNAGINLK